MPLSLALVLSISCREENICHKKVDPQIMESMNGGKGYNTITMMLLLLLLRQIFRGVIWFMSHTHENGTLLIFKITPNIHIHYTILYSKKMMDGMGWRIYLNVQYGIFVDRYIIFNKYRTLICAAIVIVMLSLSLKYNSSSLTENRTIRWIYKIHPRLPSGSCCCCYYGYSFEGIWNLEM